jgi:hypothetical protein
MVDRQASREQGGRGGRWHGGEETQEQSINSHHNIRWQSRKHSHQHVISALRAYVDTYEPVANNL